VRQQADLATLFSLPLSPSLSLSLPLSLLSLLPASNGGTASWLCRLVACGCTHALYLCCSACLSSVLPLALAFHCSVRPFGASAPTLSLALSFFCRFYFLSLALLLCLLLCAVFTMHLTPTLSTDHTRSCSDRCMLKKACLLSPLGMAQKEEGITRTPQAGTLACSRTEWA